MLFSSIFYLKSIYASSMDSATATGKKMSPMDLERLDPAAAGGSAENVEGHEGAFMQPCQL